MAVKTQALTDESIMPFGMHKGKYLIEVPASWLLWYRDSATGLRNEALLEYVEDNLDVLRSGN